MAVRASLLLLPNLPRLHLLLSAPEHRRQAAPNRLDSSARHPLQPLKTLASGCTGSSLPRTRRSKGHEHTALLLILTCCVYICVSRLHVLSCYAARYVDFHGPELLSSSALWTKHACPFIHPPFHLLRAPFFSHPCTSFSTAIIDTTMPRRSLASVSAPPLPSRAHCHLVSPLAARLDFSSLLSHRIPYCVAFQCLAGGISRSLSLYHTYFCCSSSVYPLCRSSPNDKCNEDPSIHASPPVYAAL